VTTSGQPDQLPDEGPSSAEPDRLGAILRRLLARGPTSEERLEEFLAEHRRQLEEQAARFDETIADIERREGLLRDSRASVERLLRLGTSDLEARESDLADLVLELTEREANLRAAEAELVRRRGELGAVELRRASVEQREQALAAREERVSAAEARLAEQEARSTAVVQPRAAETPVQLAFVPGPSYRLVEIEHAQLVKGQQLTVAGQPYVVARIGPAPLPGDRRPCAYLVQGVRGVSPSGGSS
jgi:uncharacterized protein (DUF3084 family)